jgi:hypothetical protein
VARALADPAVRDDVVRGREALLVEVDGLELAPGLERPALVRRALPRDADRGRDVTGADRALLRVVRHVGQLARVLARRTNVDELAPADMGEHVLLERPQRAVVALDARVLGRRRLRHVLRERAPLGDPLRATAVEETGVRVAEQAAHPERVRGPPVEVVAVEHDRRVARDALSGHQPREAVGVHVVADDRVVQVGVPVDLDRAGDVTGVVDEHVLVRLGDDDGRIVQVGGEPLGRDETLGVGVGGELRIGIELSWHVVPPWRRRRRFGYGSAAPEP